VETQSVAEYPKSVSERRSASTAEIAGHESLDEDAEFLALRFGFSGRHCVFSFTTIVSPVYLPI
jgi:hypothetical protein